MNNKAILVISFGTTYKDTLKKSIEACENTLAKKFKGYDLKRAFTSHMVIKKLKRVENIDIDTPTLALERIHLEGYKEVIIQPLHIIPGFEYNNKILKSVEPFKLKFNSIRVGEPLLYQNSDYTKLLEALKYQIPIVNRSEAVLFMGHGTEHHANSCYSTLQSVIDDQKLPIHIGCVEGYPEIDLILKRLKERNIVKLHLFPLMLVAGDHAQNDLAGDDPDSWKNILEGEGFKTECHMVGLGENSMVHDMFTEKATKLVKETCFVL